MSALCQKQTLRRPLAMIASEAREIAQARGTSPMELPRRKFLGLAIGAGALSAWLDAALALDYPTRPVHLIVGFPAGFTPDIIARLTGLARVPQRGLR